MAKIKGISFSQEYEEEYEYVMGIKGASAYICELIRKDLNSKKKTEDEVLQKVVKLLSEFKS